MHGRNNRLVPIITTVVLILSVVTGAQAFEAEEPIVVRNAPKMRTESMPRKSNGVKAPPWTSREKRDLQRMGLLPIPAQMAETMRETERKRHDHPHR